MEIFSDSHLDLDLRHEPARPPSGPVSRRPKSSLRLKYEAETHVIERKLGSLEAIRSTLGLSQRKMAQLLLVDPSAWTRWTKGEDQAPPHIFRMLQWYLALQEKYPALDVNFWLNTVAQVNEKSASFGKESGDQEMRLRALELSHERLDQQEKLVWNAFAIREAALRRQIIWLASVTTLVGGLLGFAIAHWLK
jgi:transcriptional regulator with XRE-family HTH domain